MSANYDVIAIFPVFGQFGPIQKLDSQHMVCKTYIFINSNLKNLPKAANNKKPLTQPSHYHFE